MTMGRPVKYTVEFIENEGSELLKWMDSDPVNNWWLKGFCIQRGYAPQRFDDWQAKNAFFAECLKLAKAKQEEYLIKGAVFQPKLNTQIVQLILQSNHNYVPKHGVEIEGEITLFKVVKANVEEDMEEDMVGGDQ